jgi:hypothetical protein
MVPTLNRLTKHVLVSSHAIPRFTIMPLTIQLRQKRISHKKKKRDPQNILAHALPTNIADLDPKYVQFLFDAHSRLDRNPLLIKWRSILFPVMIKFITKINALTTKENRLPKSITSKLYEKFLRTTLELTDLKDELQLQELGVIIETCISNLSKQYPFKSKDLQSYLSAYIYLIELCLKLQCTDIGVLFINFAHKVANLHLDIMTYRAYVMDMFNSGFAKEALDILLQAEDIAGLSANPMCYSDFFKDLHEKLIHDTYKSPDDFMNDFIVFEKMRLRLHSKGIMSDVASADELQVMVVSLEKRLKYYEKKKTLQQKIAEQDKNSSN